MVLTKKSPFSHLWDRANRMPRPRDTEHAIRAGGEDFGIDLEDAAPRRPATFVLVSNPYPAARTDLWFVRAEKVKL